MTALFVMASHIPAWKRVGLKLKFARDGVETTNVSQQADSKVNGTHEHGHDEAERPSKRQRLSVGKSQPSNGTSRSIEAESSALSGNIQTDDLGLKRKKSVTFTNDTKVEDGDSRVTIDFPPGSPGSTPGKKKPSAPERTVKDTVPDPSQEVTTPETESPSLKKRKQKSKSGKKSRLSNGPTQSKKDLALDYLKQHRSDHESWKFNKNRDVWVLSHAHEVETIPDSHILALAGYLRGLPDRAGARRRLIEQCKEALTDVPMGDLKQDDRDKIEACLNGGSPNGDSSFEDVIQRVLRPAVLLLVLGEPLDVAQPISGKDTLNGPSKSTSTKKSSKSRTAAAVEISSSEDESDSDDSSVTQEVVQPKKGVGKVGLRLGRETGTVDTSSSGSDTDSDGSSESASSSSDSSSE